MDKAERTYIAIDLKSFYASVECVERGLDPLTTNLVVADSSRTEKTICLAVSPSLKSYGIPGRPRLFEVIQKVKEINSARKAALSTEKKSEFDGVSFDHTMLQNNPGLKLDYITAVPHMARYMAVSTRIYQVYLGYIAPEDIHVYSIDEVFIDATAYLDTYHMSARELTMKMILDVLKITGITATAGIGTNLFLCKIAMDVEAKHIPADSNGVRIAELDEKSYRQKLWDHRPLTDFWRVGRGYAKKLEANGIFTMGDIARCSIGKSTDYYNEDLLYRLFGINAELLIDHSWGWEPCTMADIKSYKPTASSLGSGQVLQCPYTFDNARLIVLEMTELLVLDLVDKKLVTDQLVLTIGYDIDNLRDPARRIQYHGEITKDHYGREIPKHAHGTSNLDSPSSSTRIISEAMLSLYDKITDHSLLIRRINLAANNVMDEASVSNTPCYEQLDLFTDYNALEKERANENNERARERKIQEAMLSIKKKYGKNAILKGTNLEEGATTIMRNDQIGGHRA